MLDIILMTLAAAGGENPSTTAPAIVIEGDRRVCQDVQATGSILSRRVCKTKAQWERERAAGKAFADQRSREQTILQQTQIRVAKPRDPP